MPKLKNDEGEIVRRDSLNDIPLGAQTSVNDDAHNREQDQAIAQLATQLADASHVTWRHTALTASEGGVLVESVLFPAPVPRTQVERLSRMLSLMSGQVAAAQEYRANSGAGSAFVVRFGSVGSIACASREVMRTVVTELNERTREVLAPARERILAEIVATIRGEQVTIAHAHWVVMATGQLAVFVASIDEAEALVLKLNGVINTTLTPLRSSIEQELMRVVEGKP